MVDADDGYDVFPFTKRREPGSHICLPGSVLYL